MAGATKEALLQKDYSGFLKFGPWSEIRHVIHSYKRFRGSRSKGLAISDDGKVMRLVISDIGYNDRFHMDGHAIILTYVCGTPEETRRLHQLRKDDLVKVTLDQKEVLGFRGEVLTPERHGILHGRFRRIKSHIDRKADGEFLVPHAIVEILGYETRANEIEYFSATAPLPDVLTPTSSNGNMPLQMILDTESAPPSSGQNGARIGAFPVLEVAYRIVSHDFREEFTSYRSFVRYPEAASASLGNDISSAVLKFNPRVLVYGEDVYDMLGVISAHFRRVHDSGGAVIGHNVLHDIRQLQATAKLVGFRTEPFLLNVFDTVRSASSFVANAEVRWMKLHELANCCGIVWDTSDATRGQHRAAGDVEVLHKILKASFDVSHLAEFYEVVEFP
jgi:hypothetical protein